MLKAILCLLFILLWGPKTRAQPSATPVSESACRWTQNAQIIFKASHELHQIWQFSENPVFWSALLPASASLEAFRQAVQTQIPELEPHAYVLKHPPAEDGEAYNKRLALSSRVARLEPINCLEALLLSEQTARLPMLQTPSEFGAFILRRRNESGDMRYKVYFSTLDQPGLKMNALVMAQIESDRQLGWTVWAHLHNHNFFPEKADPYASPSPSKTDIEFARMLKQSLALENLWVTNGFHTLHLPQQAFEIFHGHSDEPQQTAK